MWLRNLGMNFPFFFFLGNPVLILAKYMSELIHVVYMYDVLT